MATLVSRNPATGEVVGEVTRTPGASIPEVVKRSRAAQSSWGSMAFEERSRVLSEAGLRFEERAEELGRLITREMGKPLKEAIGEVRSCGAGLSEQLAEIGEALAPETVEDERVRSVIHRDPLGVCACITPWNFPMLMPHWLVLPALAAGNSVVLKPSEETPLCGQAYADVIGAELPLGVLQVVHGDDEQGKALVEADVDLVTFTGSRAAGKHILRAASDDLKRVILELGGKDPMIVLEDADLEKAARFAAQSSFRNAGQVCVSTERIFVPHAIVDRFVELLVEAAHELTVGDGLDEASRVGPMVNARQRDHVLEQVERAIAAGARVATAISPPRGNFVAPIVLTDVRDDMAIARDETFGPVACVSGVKDGDEAVERANRTRFGLGAVVFGGDLDRAGRVARRLSAGMVGINRACGGAEGTPWVGARESGYGFHRSRDGHRQFTQTRVVSRPRPAA